MRLAITGSVFAGVTLFAMGVAFILFMEEFSCNLEELKASSSLSISLKSIFRDVYVRISEKHYVLY